MKYTVRENDIVLDRFDCLDLRNTLLCGQAFRWKETEEGTFRGTVKGTTLLIEQKDNEIKVTIESDLNEYSK